MSRSLSWSLLQQNVGRFMRERGEFAGAPVPLPGYELVIEPHYPYQELGGDVFGDDDQEGATAGLEPGERVVNRFTCARRKVLVTVTRTADGRARAYGFGRGPAAQITTLLQSLGVAAVWPLEAELKACERLQDLIGDHKFRMYMTTGMFLETSKRSKVVYVFRRLRPTLAIRASEKDCRCLAALCMHPIAYYEATYAGCMVPTDDTIAHLLLMRSDEVMFWRRSNQWSIHDVAACL